MIDVRNADDFDHLFIHRLAELREAKNETRFGIRNFHAARLDALNVVERVGTQLTLTSHRAQGSKAWLRRRRVFGCLQSVFMSVVVVVIRRIPRSTRFPYTTRSPPYWSAAAPSP